jgi:hypothetical protein
VDILLNPERVAPVGRNRVAVEIGYSIHYPGLPQRQPWALRYNRFAVKQFESQNCRGFSKTFGCSSNLNPPMTNESCQMRNGK